jgi:hypothetical protein
MRDSFFISAADPYPGTVAVFAPVSEIGNGKNPDPESGINIWDHRA